MRHQLKAVPRLPQKGKPPNAREEGQPHQENGAGNGIRTRDTKLGKLVLYQLSYARSSSDGLSAGSD
jgi:hypothetical protein